MWKTKLKIMRKKSIVIERKNETMKTNNNYLEFKLNKNLEKFFDKIDITEDQSSDKDYLVKYIESCWWDINYKGSVLKCCKLSKSTESDCWFASITEWGDSGKSEIFRFNISKDLLMIGKIRVINSGYLHQDETVSLINVFDDDNEITRSRYIFNEQAFDSLPRIDGDSYILIRINNRNRMFVLDQIQPELIRLRDNHRQYIHCNPLQFLSGLVTSLNDISSSVVNRTSEGLLIPKVTGIYPIGIIGDDGKLLSKSDEMRSYSEDHIVEIER